MQHTDDDFLPDEAALAERDRALLDSRLERNRVVGHVDAEERVASLDAGSVQRVWCDDPRTCGDRRGNEPPLSCTSQKHAVAGNAELIDARHRHRLAVERRGRVLIVEPIGQSGRAAG